MNRNCICAILAVVSMTFVMCGNDDKTEPENKTEPEIITQTPTEQEMYDTLVYNDRLMKYNLFGDVKTMVESRSDVSTWENNAVKLGYVYQRNRFEFNNVGRLTKNIYEATVPASIEWTTNHQLETILVVTNEVKPNTNSSFSYDEKNRVNEYISQQIYFRGTVGNFNTPGYTMAQRDTFLYQTIQDRVNEGEPLTVTTRESWVKKTIRYDDQAKTAVLTVYSSSDGNNYVPLKKYVCQQDHYGQIDLNPEGTTDSESFNAVKSFEDSPSAKTTIKYDDKNNKIEKYILKYENGKTTVENHFVWEYSYY